MKLSTRTATPEDAGDIAALRNGVAAELTRLHGAGRWSGSLTKKGVLWDMRRCRIVLAVSEGETVGTMSLGTIKPWAIDRSFFTKAKRPIYLTSMAVKPERQRQGIGRAMIEAAKRATAEWPGDALWLDAFDAEAGAGAFYAKCGFRECGRNLYRGAGLIYFEWRV